MARCFRACDNNSPWKLCPVVPPKYLVTVNAPAYILYNGVQYQNVSVLAGTYPIVSPIQGYDVFSGWQLTSTSATVADLNAASTTLTITNAGASLVATTSIPMVLRIRVTAPPSSLELPFTFAPGNSISVNWGDETPVTTYSIAGTIQHTYSTTGTYIIKTSGSALGFGSLGYTGASAVTNVLQWGVVGRISLYGAGYIGASLVTDVIQWGILGLNSLYGAFYDAYNLVSVPTTFIPTVTDTSYMFNNARAFNSDISQWDVSNVTSMNGMFSGAISFNQPIGSWNVSNVQYMDGMFNGASVFNQPLEAWRPNSATGMRGMFYSAEAFNQPLNAWFSTVSIVTDMGSMFTLATAFNQPLNMWNVSKVTNMSSMFASATAFNQNLSSWMATNTITAYTMFCLCPVYGNLSYYPQFSGKPIGYPLYGCDQGPYLVTMSTNGAAGSSASATISFNGASYTDISVPDGTYLITASVPGGYTFNEWIGGSVDDNRSPETILTVNGYSVTVQANFTMIPLPRYTVTMATNVAEAEAQIYFVDGGVGQWQNSAIVLDGEYDIRAIAPAGYTFNGWIGATVTNPSQENTRVIINGFDVTVQATYVLPMLLVVDFTLNPDITDPGTPIVPDKSVFIGVAGTGNAAYSINDGPQVPFTPPYNINIIYKSIYNPGDIVPSRLRIYSDTGFTEIWADQTGVSAVSFYNLLEPMNVLRLGPSPESGGGNTVPNTISSIDISKLTNLIYLVCTDNRLGDLDVTPNILLETIICSNNILTSLVVSHNTALVDIRCENNRLTGLDVSNKPALLILRCEQNNLDGLDVMQNTALLELYCAENNLTDLNVTKNTALLNLDCNNNNLSDLDVTYNMALESLICNNNNLSGLNVMNNRQLTFLDCGYNSLTSINVEQNTALNSLICSNNTLSTIDIMQNRQLTLLICDHNSLTSLNVSQNTQLTLLICDHNRLTALNVSQNTALVELICNDNNIDQTNADTIVAQLVAHNKSSGTLVILQQKTEVLSSNGWTSLSSGLDWRIY